MTARWSDPERATAVRLRAQGLTCAQIATHLPGRTRLAVRGQLTLHGPIDYDRAINAQPWEPLPSMVKRLCTRCRFWFATPVIEPRDRCPTCILRAARPGRGHQVSASA